MCCLCPISCVSFYVFYDFCSRNGQKSPPNTTDSILAAEVEHLERDLTEFSLSSMERPKKDSPSQRIIQTGSSVRTMTEDELEKWQNKQFKEHKKAENLLSDGKRKDSYTSSEELDKSLM